LQHAKLPSGCKCKLRVDGNAQLSNKTEHRSGTFVSNGGHLHNILAPQIIEPDGEVDDGFDFVQRSSCRIEVFPKFLCSPSARTLGNVQNNTLGSTPPLIGKVGSFSGRQASNERFGNERQCSCVLPSLQFLEMTHAAEYDG